jgi:hypothetical protein
MRLVEARFPPGGRVVFETGGRDVSVHQQVWVLEGAIDVILGEECYRLHEGDCLAMLLDRLTMFHNPAQIDGLADVLVDCVEGGASESVMHPLARDRAVAFWRRVAQGVAAGKRAPLVA